MMKHKIEDKINKESKYTIYESDKIKGKRTTIVDKDTGLIIEERE